MDIIILCLVIGGFVAIYILAEYFGAKGEVENQRDGKVHLYVALRPKTFFAFILFWNVPIFVILFLAGYRAFELHAVVQSFILGAALVILRFSTRIQKLLLRPDVPIEQIRDFNFAIGLWIFIPIGLTVMYIFKWL